MLVSMALYASCILPYPPSWLLSHRTLCDLLVVATCTRHVPSICCGRCTCPFPCLYSSTSATLPLSFRSDSPHKVWTCSSRRPCTTPQVTATAPSRQRFGRGGSTAVVSVNTRNGDDPRRRARIVGATQRASRRMVSDWQCTSIPLRLSANRHVCKIILVTATRCGTSEVTHQCTPRVPHAPPIPWDRRRTPTFTHEPVERASGWRNRTCARAHVVGTRFWVPPLARSPSPNPRPILAQPRHRAPITRGSGVTNPVRSLRGLPLRRGPVTTPCSPTQKRMPVKTTAPSKQSSRPVNPHRCRAQPHTAALRRPPAGRGPTGRPRRRPGRPPLGPPDRGRRRRRRVGRGLPAHGRRRLPAATATR